MNVILLSVTNSNIGKSMNCSQGIKSERECFLEIYPGLRKHDRNHEGACLRVLEKSNEAV